MADFVSIAKCKSEQLLAVVEDATVPLGAMQVRKRTHAERQVAAGIVQFN